MNMGSFTASLSSVARQTARRNGSRYRLFNWVLSSMHSRKPVLPTGEVDAGLPLTHGVVLDEVEAPVDGVLFVEPLLADLPQRVGQVSGRLGDQVGEDVADIPAAHSGGVPTDRSTGSQGRLASITVAALPLSFTWGPPDSHLDTTNREAPAQLQARPTINPPPRFMGRAHWAGSAAAVASLCAACSVSRSLVMDHVLFGYRPTSLIYEAFSYGT